MDKREIEQIRYQLLFNKVSFSSKEMVLEVNSLDRAFIFNHDIVLLKYCSEAIKNDRNTVLELVKINGNNIRLLKRAFKDDEEIVLAALKSRPNTFQYINKRFKENDEMVQLVLEAEPKQIIHCLEKFKKDKEVVSKIIKSDFRLFEHVHPSLKNDLKLLNQIWEIIKEKHNHNQYTLSSQTSWLIDNMGDRIRSKFSQVNFDSNLLSNQIDSYFSNIVLNRELNKELSNTKKIESKKLKI